MPDDDWNEVRDQIAFGRALDAFEAHMDRDATLGELLLSEPWFATSGGEIGLLTPDERVVVVEVNVDSDGQVLRAGPLREGPFNARVRDTTDTAGAARTLGMSQADAEQLLSRVEQAVRAGVTAYGQATAAFDREQQRLTRNMNTLTDGLERIARVYGKHVHLEYEDPEAFGGGHYVLYPTEHSEARFAVEERYTGSDWSDPDRLPTSWAWRAERTARRTDGTHGWRVSARGAVDSDDAAMLLRQAEIWAKQTRNVAEHVKSLQRDPAGRRPPDAPRM
ncbi:MAG: hypothetical protein M9886_05075 [Candidatus Nanopelagicales bacterium]|uniref:hypothetical protein n=1 Tax=Rhodococcus pyridinivorans TaxID=103816 RepID=UPI002657EB4F|nr:hypothetical protein [Rhodococcus pyridinivorans]MCO5299306.1 hypothetical protein [Candidatus Nanopelagicales bacterium]HPE11181.1 hypothetical protein [Actinomycetota bacterium]HRV64761.1 hypothetical protein [Candidatus Nanopelagicales bacterium]